MILYRMLPFFLRKWKNKATFAKDYTLIILF